MIKSTTKVVDFFICHTTIRVIKFNHFNEVKNGGMD